MSTFLTAGNLDVGKRVLGFFPKTKLQNVKFSTVTLQNYKSSNVKMFELPYFRTVTLQNFKILNAKMLELPHFRNVKLSIL
jgi:hypothetical protein